MASLPVLRPPIRAPFAFGQIVCAVNPSRGAQEAVHQATQLTGPLDTLTFVAVTDTRGDGDKQAAWAVEAASAAAHADGVEATTVIVRAHDLARALVEAARHAGLLVVGAHSAGKSSAVPVLVARALPELAFPGVTLACIQGVEDHHAAVVSATIAARRHSRVVLGHVGQSSAALRHALTDMAAEVRTITGKDPVVISVGGHPVDRLGAMARSVGAGLVVLGSHVRGDPAGLPGVSERVAQRATCSVLVLSPSAPATENYGRLPESIARSDVADPDGSGGPGRCNRG